jgi:hypothetical protein
VKNSNSIDSTQPSSNKDDVKSENSDSLSTPKNLSKTMGNLESSSSVNSAGAATGDSSLEGSGEHTDALEDNQDGDERAKEMMDKKASKNRKGAIINQNLKNKVTPNGGK